jgi:hypothetical protein
MCHVFIPDYMMLGNVKPNMNDFENVRHEMTMPKLPKSKRAKLSFHHYCGTTQAGADPRVSCGGGKLLLCTEQFELLKVFR